MIVKSKFQLEEPVFSEEELSSALIKEIYFHDGCLVICRVESSISAGPICTGIAVLRPWNGVTVEGLSFRCF